MGPVPPDRRRPRRAGAPVRRTGREEVRAAGPGGWIDRDEHQGVLPESAPAHMRGGVPLRVPVGAVGGLSRGWGRGRSRGWCWSRGRRGRPPRRPAAGPFPASGPNRPSAGRARRRKPPPPTPNPTPNPPPASFRSSSTPGATSPSSSIRTSRSGWRRRRRNRVSPSCAGASSPATTSTPSGWRCISRRAPPRGPRLPGSICLPARCRRTPTSAVSRSTVSRHRRPCGSRTRPLLRGLSPWTWSTRAVRTKGSATRPSGRLSRCGSTEPGPALRPAPRPAARTPRPLPAAFLPPAPRSPKRTASPGASRRTDSGGASSPSSASGCCSASPRASFRWCRSCRPSSSPEGEPPAAGRGASPFRSPTSRGARSPGRWSAGLPDSSAPTSRSRSRVPGPSGW